MKYKQHSQGANDAARKQLKTWGSESMPLVYTITRRETLASLQER